MSHTKTGDPAIVKNTDPFLSLSQRTDSLNDWSLSICQDNYHLQVSALQSSFQSTVIGTGKEVTVESSVL